MVLGSAGRCRSPAPPGEAFLGSASLSLPGMRCWVSAGRCPRRSPRSSAAALPRPGTRVLPGQRLEGGSLSPGSLPIGPGAQLLPRGFLLARWG